MSTISMVGFVLLIIGTLCLTVSSFNFMVRVIIFRVLRKQELTRTKRENRASLFMVVSILIVSIGVLLLRAG